MTLTRCSSMPRAETLVKPNGSTRRTRPPAAGRRPSLDDHALPGGDLHGVGGEQVGDDLEVVRIADLDQRRRRRRRRARSSRHAQHDAGDRRAHRDAVDSAGAARSGVSTGASSAPAPARARATASSQLRPGTAERRLARSCRRARHRRDRAATMVSRAAQLCGALELAGGEVALGRAPAPARPRPARAASAACTAASACAALRDVEEVGSIGWICATTVSSAMTRSPDVERRCARMRPATGAETTKTSFTRVSPSSSTVTSAARASTSRDRPAPAAGRKAYQQPAADAPAAAAAQKTGDCRAHRPHLLPRLQHGDQIEAVEAPPHEQRAETQWPPERRARRRP